MRDAVDAFSERNALLLQAMLAHCFEGQLFQKYAIPIMLGIGLLFYTVLVNLWRSSALE